MNSRCRICGKDRPAGLVGTCRTPVQHLEAAGRGARCPVCGRDHLACVRFTSA